MSHRLTHAAALLGLVLAVGCNKKPKPDPPPDSNPPADTGNGSGDGNGSDRGGGGPRGGPKAPAGWHEAHDTVAGYKLLMPNKTLFHANYQRPNLDKMQATSCSHYTKGQDVEPFVRTVTYVPLAGFKLGTKPDELYAAFQLSHRNFENSNTILEKKPVTLGGKPALLIVSKPVDITAGAKLPDDPQWAKQRLEERKKTEAQRRTYYVAAHGPRVVVLEILSPGEPPAEFIKTVTESFTFL